MDTKSYINLLTAKVDAVRHTLPDALDALRVEDPSDMTPEQDVALRKFQTQIIRLAEHAGVTLIEE